MISTSSEIQHYGAFLSDFHNKPITVNPSGPLYVMYVLTLNNNERRSSVFRKMENCLFVSAMGPQGGGRNPLTPRYSRHFNTVSIVDFDSATLTTIFQTIIDWYLQKEGFPKNIQVIRQDQRTVSGNLI